MPWATALLLALPAFCFGLSAAAARGDEERLLYWLVAAGARVNELLRAGEWWRLPASALLHGSLPHLLFNLVGLALPSWLLERRGLRPLIPILFVAGSISGGLLSLVLRQSPSVGSSGALFALLAAVSLLFVRDFRGRSDGRLLLALVLPAVLIVSLVTGLMTEGVDSAAHLGGAAGGLLVVLLLRCRAGKPVGAGVRFLCAASLLVLAFAAGTVASRLEGRMEFEPWRLEVAKPPGDGPLLQPVGWREGLFEEGSCTVGARPQGEAIRCFVDPYYSIFLSGPREELALGPVHREWLDRAAGEPPRLYRHYELFWAESAQPGGGALALLVFAPLAGHYVPLFSALRTGLVDPDRHRPPALTYQAPQSGECAQPIE